jgi:glycosyltransferase involved in cell wall biosynthesis
MFKVAILFHNIGGYHAARLSALKKLCDDLHWDLLVIQETAHAVEHPWGTFTHLSSFTTKTLVSAQESSQSSAAVKCLRNVLNEYLPDVVVIPGWGFPLSQVALKWAQTHGKISIVMSESKQDDSPRIWWKEFLKTWFYIRYFHAAIVGGIKHRQYLVSLGFPEHKIFYGYDVVDNQYFLSRTRDSDLNNSNINIPQCSYFITVTRFIPRKNIIGLLRSYLQYRQICPEQAWDLVICGSGVEEPKIKRFIEDHHLSNVVHLPGFITYEHIPLWYAHAGAFIHPALQEQWGLVVNEAMASGLPVLVSNRCGCFPELVIEGETGFGFDPENIDQLCNLMLKMSSGQIDRVAMGKAAQNHIANFSPEYFAQGLKSAIEVSLENFES